MVKIENLTNRLVSLRLNNGKTLHLPPRMVSAELVEAQVAHNDKVVKLQERRVIALSESPAKGADDRTRGRAARPARKTTPSGGSTRAEGE